MKVIGYKDTDKKIEVNIYGLVFEVKNILDENLLKEMEENKNNAEKVENYINKLLGENAVEKINEKRKNDGYKEMDLLIETNILGLIFSTYAEEIGNIAIDNLSNTAQSINTKYNRFENRYNRRHENYNNRRRY